MKPKPTVSAAAVLLALASLAHANPSGQTVANGTATFSTNGSTLTVTNSPNAIINWQAFSIGATEQTRFVQQSASSAVLNRVTGSNPSSILGSLTSNGSVFLVNPNGILFGAGAQVNVGGLVASTLDISNANFLAGNLQFAASGPNPGQVTNNGTIVATDSYVALIGAGIQSAGSISAGPSGIALVAGDPASLTVAGGALTSASSGSNLPNASISVTGVIDSPTVFIDAPGPISFVNSTIGNPLPLPPLQIPLLVDGGNISVGGGAGNVTIGGGAISLAGGGNLVQAGGIVAQPGTVSLTPQQPGTVSLQGSVLAAAGPTAPVAVTSIALNLEKRQVGF